MIVVTGTTGLIGGNLVRALLMQGHPVRGVIHQDQRALADLDFERIKADLLDLNSLRQAFTDAEIVFHCAGLISLRQNTWPALEAINITGTRNVIQACKDCGVRRLVFFSSIQALQPESSDRLVDENQPLVESLKAPPYDRSKALAESEVRNAIQKGLDAVILYPTAVVGPFDYRPSFIGQALLMITERRLPALVKGGFDWVDVRDVTNAAIQAGLNAPAGERYILSGHWHSVKEVADLVGDWPRNAQDRPGSRSPRLVVSTELAALAAPILPFLAPFIHIDQEQARSVRGALGWLQINQRINHAHASTDLIYQPRPFRQTIYDTLNWFQQTGKIHKQHA
jgi:dihydroflavonol-4-reductase